jgi:competence protein ComEA
MRSRFSSNDQVAEVARRRLELLSAELAAIRRDPAGPPTPDAPDGSGEPLLPASTAPEHIAAALPPDTVLPGTSRPQRPGRHARRSSGLGLAAGWLRDRLPGALQGRVRIGAPQLSLLAVVVAAAMGMLAWWTVRATDAGELVTTGSLTSQGPASADALVTPSGTPSAEPATSPSPDGLIVVDVAGKVRDPGIARLPAGSRVVDALEAAGGARRGVDLSSLNLARVLVDGEQVLVGLPHPTGLVPSAAAAPGTAGPTQLVSINRADQATLETLPGVGPVTAQAILQWRTDHGAFSAVDELLEVSGIGDATLAEIAPFVTL